MVTPPSITTTPAAPDYWDARDTMLADDVAGPGFGDPAELTDIEVLSIADSAVVSLATWHRLAPSMPTPAWKQLASPETHSGHKLHIACASFDDVRSVVARVLPVVVRAGLGCKAATSALALRRGKGVVVYLPRRASVDRDASLIVAAMAGYRPSSPVDIFGSVQLDGAVWWRHEFGGVDPGADVWSMGEYRALYVPAPVPA